MGLLVRSAAASSGHASAAAFLAYIRLCFHVVFDFDLVFGLSVVFGGGVGDSFSVSRLHCFLLIHFNLSCVLSVCLSSDYFVGPFIFDFI